MAKELKNQPGYDSEGLHRECRRLYRGGNEQCFKLHPELRRISSQNSLRQQQEEEPVALGALPSAGAVTRTSNIGFQNRSVFGSSNRYSNINL